MIPHCCVVSHLLVHLYSHSVHNLKKKKEIGFTKSLSHCTFDQRCDSSFVKYATKLFIFRFCVAFFFQTWTLENSNMNIFYLSFYRENT